METKLVPMGHTAIGVTGTATQGHVDDWTLIMVGAMSVFMTLLEFTDVKI